MKACENRGEDVTEGHRVSDKTLLDLFVLLGFSDESHLLRLTAVEVHIKEKPSTDKCLFLSNEREAGPLVETMNLNRYAGNPKHAQRDESSR